MGTGDTLLPSVERRIDTARGEVLETRYTYDLAGRLLSEDGPLPGTDDANYYRYDVHGRRTWEIGPLGTNGLRNARHFITYRAADDKLVNFEDGTVVNPASSVLAQHTHTQISYDTRRNPVSEAVSSAGTTHGLIQRSFDDRGRLVCETRRMHPAAFSSPPAACTLGSAGDFGPDRITRHLYDAGSQLLLVQRAYGTPLQQNYASYTYSANGQRTSITDANGNRAELRYDGHDRQSRWVFPSKTTPGALNESDYEAYGYDAAGGGRKGRPAWPEYASKSPDTATRSHQRLEFGSGSEDLQQRRAVDAGRQGHSEAARGGVVSLSTLSLRPRP